MIFNSNRMNDISNQFNVNNMELTSKQKIRIKLFLIIITIVFAYLYWKNRYYLEYMMNFGESYFKFIVIGSGIIVVLFPTLKRVLSNYIYENFPDIADYWDINYIENDDNEMIIKKKHNKVSYSDSAKKSVAELQDWKCGKCMKPINILTTHLSQTIPSFAGGNNDLNNYKAYCFSCDKNKSVEDYINYVAT